MLMKAELSYQDHAPLQLNHVPLTAHTYMTQGEKTMLVYTKYTSLHYFNYLTFYVSYTTSVNCIESLNPNC